MYSLESPDRGDANEYTQYTIFNIKTKMNLNYSKSAALGFFSKGLKNEFETAVVNEPSVFEPLKFDFSLKLKFFMFFLHFYKRNNFYAFLLLPGMINPFQNWIYSKRKAFTFVSPS